MTTLRTSRARALGGLLLFAAAGAAHAAFPCVASSDELQQYLSSAKQQKSPYEIHIVASANAYQLGPGNDFVYLPDNTKILGGYAPGCGSREENAANTIIDFGGYYFGLLPNYDGDTQRLEIDGLTLRHGAGWAAREGAVGDFSDDPGYIILHDVRFTDFSDDHGYAPISLYVVKGTVQMVDAQFDHLNQTTGNPCAVQVDADNNTTFTGNFITADLSNGKDFCFGASDESGTFTVRVDNSIIWGSNAGADTPTLRGVNTNFHNHPLNISTHYDIAHAFIGYGTAAAPVAQIAADPHWTNPANGDYTLADIGSPAVNSGNSSGLGAPYYDIYRNLRTIGSHPDRGAHESPFDDSTTLKVKTVADSGPDSLRAAITNANLYGGAHSVVFELAGCPSTIALASPLPSVTSTIIVDGYSQNGAWPNDSDTVFDANLCVMIKPQTSAGTAFSVQTNAKGGSNGSLTLRGLGIGGFGQDVLLLGGANHVIVGNQFGGVANGVDLGTSSLSDITVGVDATNIVIGSLDPASRNVIGGASGGLGDGINIESGIVSDTDHCQIVNNWIGLAPDGLTAIPNTFGLMLSGDGCAVVGNRIVGNSVHQLWINGGNDNVVQRNVIGYDIGVNGYANNGVGILVAGNNNTIGGSATGSAPGDLIVNIVGKMTGGGIVVASGAGNSIRGNSVTNNGPGHDGDGMDIDLGNNGPTANTLANSGPNDLQPFPVIDSLLYSDYPPTGDLHVPAALSGHLTAQPGTYKIDLYFSYDCSIATGRAHTQSYMADFTVTVPAGGTVNFTESVVLPIDKPYNALALTATGQVSGTSEASTCFTIGNGTNDAIFKSGFGYGAEY